jgi:integrase
VKRLSHDLAPSTIEVAHGIVAGVFKDAVRDRRITASPCEGTKLPKRHREPIVPLTHEQVIALHAALPERYRALVTLAASTGLRQGEVLGLTLDHCGLRPPCVSPLLRVDQHLVVVDGQPPFLGPPKKQA